MRPPAGPRSSTAGTGLRLAAGLALLLLLAACAGTAPRSLPRPPPGASAIPAGSTPASPQRAADNVLFHAIGLIGTPYHWGGNTPASGFDCSGLVDYVFRTSAGIDLPRSSRAMSRIRARRITNPANLASGDLLFFRTEHHRISHVAIYVGNGRFVHAPNTGGTVRLDNLSNPYWRRHFAFARRVLD